jgi:hypothetical protein
MSQRKTDQAVKCLGLEHHVPCPSSLNTSSRLSSSFSFFPRLRFFPPFPLFCKASYRIRNVFESSKHGTFWFITLGMVPLYLVLCHRRLERKCQRVTVRYVNSVFPGLVSVCSRLTATPDETKKSIVREFLSSAYIVLFQTNH